MARLYVATIFAAICFGIWPLIMNRSGLSGTLSAWTFTAIVLLFVTPFAYFGLEHNLRFGLGGVKVQWWYVIISGILGGAGILCFNGMLSKASPEQVGIFVVFMTVIQVAIPASYHVIINGKISLTTGLGFICAALAAILLLKR